MGSGGLLSIHRDRPVSRTWQKRRIRHSMVAHVDRVSYVGTRGQTVPVEFSRVSLQIVRGCLWSDIWITLRLNIQSGRRYSSICGHAARVIRSRSSHRAGLTFSRCCRLYAREIARSVGDLQQPVLGTIAAGRSSITLDVRSRLEHTQARIRVHTRLTWRGCDALPQVEKVRGGQPRRDATRLASIVPMLFPTSGTDWNSFSL